MIKNLIEKIVFLEYLVFFKNFFKVFEIQIQILLISNPQCKCKYSKNEIQLNINTNVFDPKPASGLGSIMIVID